MVDKRAQELIDFGNGLYDTRAPLLSFWQEVADQFYPERADFTHQHVLGEDFAGHLMDSYPAMLRRELGNSISAMLRPRERPWFRVSTLDEGRDMDPDNKVYLETFAERMRFGLYHPNARFVNVSKQGDHDFVTFGQTVLSVEENKDRTHPFFRQFHLRDCVWLENSENEVDHLHRKDQLTARKIKGLFREANLAQSIKDACEKKPGQNFQVRCIVMPSDEYDYNGSDQKKGGKKLPFTVIYVDVQNQKMLRESGLKFFPYVIPRWHTVSGSQYAFSPCTTIALPDARMAQSMAQLILEAGEKSVDPPLVAVEEAIRDVNTAAGAMTWADYAYDGKLSETIRALDFNNDMQVAFAMRQDMREMLNKAWFVEKLTMPRPEGADQMTATEVQVRNDEFIRNLLPLFEPMEMEYNVRILDKTFEVMRNLGMFPTDEIPPGLAGSDVTWQFESPIQASQQRLKVAQFQETLQLIGAAAQLGHQAMPIDLGRALQDAINGTMAPADWFLTEEERMQQAEQQAQEQAQAQALQEAQAIAQTAQQAGEAGQAINQAMVPPELQGPGARPALPAPNEAA